MDSKFHGMISSSIRPFHGMIYYFSLLLNPSKHTAMCSCSSTLLLRVYAVSLKLACEYG